MRLIKFISFLLLMLFLCSSCMLDPDFYKESVSYRVEANTLNIRYKANTSSRILGKLKKGDTISSKSNYKNWKIIHYRGYLAYVDSSYLTRLVKPKYKALELKKETSSSVGIFRLIDKYSHWDYWVFWVITIVLLLISLFLFITGTVLLNGTESVERWEENSFAGMNFLPFAAILVGFLFGLVYYFWPKDIQVAIYVDHIWRWPAGKGFLYWYLWFLFYSYTITAIILGIYDLVAFRYFAIIRIIYFLLVCSFIIFTMIFVANASIVILVIVGSISTALSFFSAGSSTVETAEQTKRRQKQQDYERQRRRDQEEEATRLFWERKNREEDGW